jgi:hypothetical protein
MEKHTDGRQSSVRLRPIALMMDAVSTSEVSVNLYDTSRRNIPGDC